MKKILAIGSTILSTILLKSTAFAADPITITVVNPLPGGSVECIIEKAIGYMLLIGSPLAVAMYVWAGFLFLNSGGDPAKTKKARTAIIWTTVGLAVLILGRSLVAIVADFLGASLPASCS